MYVSFAVPVMLQCLLFGFYIQDMLRLMYAKIDRYAKNRL